jgi:hypothetical protein
LIALFLLHVVITQNVTASLVTVVKISSLVCEVDWKVSDTQRVTKRLTNWDEKGVHALSMKVVGEEGKIGSVGLKLVMAAGVMRIDGLQSSAKGRASP